MNRQRPVVSLARALAAAPPRPASPGKVHCDVGPAWLMALAADEVLAMARITAVWREGAPAGCITPCPEWSPHAATYVH
jgi:hypothetical protein